jgi:hypothetical protein
MASLGSFEAAAREYAPDGADQDTFDFYGETFVVTGTVPAIVELTITAALAGKASGVDGDAAMYEALKSALTVPARETDGKTVSADPSAWERFYGLALTKNAPSELLTAITFNIMGAQLGRPTVQRSTSSPGPLPTSTSSNSSASDTPA